MTPYPYSLLSLFFHFHDHCSSSSSDTWSPLNPHPPLSPCPHMDRSLTGLPAPRCFLQSTLFSALRETDMSNIYNRSDGAAVQNSSVASALGPAPCFSPGPSPQVPLPEGCAQLELVPSPHLPLCPQSRNPEPWGSCCTKRRRASVCVLTQAQ